MCSSLSRFFFSCTFYGSLTMKFSHSIGIPASTSNITCYLSFELVNPVLNILTWSWCFEIGLAHQMQSWLVGYDFGLILPFKITFSHSLCQLKRGGWFYRGILLLFNFYSEFWLYLSPSSSGFSQRTGKTRSQIIYAFKLCAVGNNN